MTGLKQEIYKIDIVSTIPATTIGPDYSASALWARSRESDNYEWESEKCSRIHYKCRYCEYYPGDDLSSQKFLQVFSALVVLTSLFGMERGLTPLQSSPGRYPQ